MDVVIVCHTEFGYVKDRQIVFKKNPLGVERGVSSLVGITDKHDARIAFVLCSEVVRHFPEEIAQN